MIILSARGVCKGLFNANSESGLQGLISPVRVSLVNTPVPPVCQYSLSGLTMACLLGVYRFFCCIFLSCCEEMIPTPSQIGICIQTSC